MEIHLSEKEIAENIISEFAEKYKLYDISFDYIECKGYDAITYYKSDEYDKLSNEEKLQFIVDVSQKTHLTKPYPSQSQASSYYYDLAIISNNHTYTDFTSDGESWLMQDKEQIFKMKTEYAESIMNSLKSNTNNNSNTNKKYYSIQRNYSGCYPNKPHYVCYEKGYCRCVANP